MLDFLYNPKGRVSRKGYFLGFFLPFVIVTQFLPLVAVGPLSFLPTIMSLLLLWPYLFVMPTKRLHDMGLSAWYTGGFVALFVTASMMAFGSVADQMSQLSQDASAAEQQEFLLRALENDPRAQRGTLLLVLTVFTQLGLFALVRGQRGRNRFGDDPKTTERGWSAR